MFACVPAFIQPYTLLACSYSRAVAPLDRFHRHRHRHYHAEKRTMDDALIFQSRMGNCTGELRRRPGRPAMWGRDLATTGNIVGARPLTNPTVLPRLACAVADNFPPRSTMKSNSYAPHAQHAPVADATGPRAGVQQRVQQISTTRLNRAEDGNLVGEIAGDFNSSWVGWLGAPPAPSAAAAASGRKPARSRISTCSHLMREIVCFVVSTYMDDELLIKQVS